MTESTSKVLDKVKKLLALSGSANEAESAAASQKAHELLREHNLSMADIPGEKVIEAQYLDEEFRRERKWRVILLMGITKANYCAMATEMKCGMERHRLYGRDYNIAAAIAIYEYLVEAIDRITCGAGAPNPNSFRVGMACRLVGRIEEEAAAEEGCTALVLSKSEAHNELKRDNPDVGSRTIAPDVDALSSLMGREAAEHVPLNRQMHGNPRPRVAIA